MSMRYFAALLIALSSCSSAAEPGRDNQQPSQAPLTQVRAGEDIVATYRMNAPDGTRMGTMIVEADESGAARLEMQVAGASAPAQFGWVTADGDVIMMASTPEGPRLIRASDMAAVSGEMFAEMAPGGLPQDAFDGFRLETAGTETVGGRTGTRYVMRIDDGKAGGGLPGMDVVIAEDPALALIGRATSHTLAPETSAAGARTPPAFRELRERMRNGAALRIHRTMVLEAIENRPIDPARLVVEGEPISRDELRAIMRRSMPPPPITQVPAPAGNSSR